MSLRTKTLVAIAVPLIIFLVLLYAILSGVIISRFAEVESQDARRSVDRVVYALNDRLAELGRIAADWGRWDSTYRFMGGANPAYSRELVDDTFETLKLNLIALIGEDGRVVYAKGFDLGLEKEVPPPAEFRGTLPPGAPLLRGREAPLTGLLRTSEGLMFIGANPILTNEGKGPSRGVIVMGRKITPEILAGLREVVRAPFELLPLEGALPTAWQSAAAQLAAGAPYVLQPAGGDVLLAFAGMDGLDGKPALVVRLLRYRDISAYGRTSLRYVTVFLMGIGAFFILLMQLIMQRFVTERVGRVSRAAVEIGYAADFSRRVPASGDDEIGRLAGSVNEMLERLEHANEEIQRVQSVREEFTSIVSHELRAPLGIIKEGVGIVVEGVDGPVSDAQKRTLDVVMRNVDRMARLITNVLDFSRVESGRLAMRFEQVDMNEIVSEAFVLMRTAAERKGIGYTLFIPERSLFAECDPERIKQVITNLVDNAIKFTDHGGVEVRLSSTDGRMHIEVADTGPGIRPEDRERIFERFGQAKTPTGRTRGTGLGLTICKHIVERHSGTIAVRSEGGKGTTFDVDLPLHPPEPSISQS